MWCSVTGADTRHTIHGGVAEVITAALPPPLVAACRHRRGCCCGGVCDVIPRGGAIRAALAPLLPHSTIGGWRGGEGGYGR